jgi:uncharacterized membrane protein
MEDIQFTISFLTGTSILAGLIIAGLKSWLKNKIKPRFGDLGVQGVLFGIGLIIALFTYGFQFVPRGILLIAVGILAGANALYQVLYKAVYQKAIKNKLDKDEIKEEVK